MPSENVSYTLCWDYLTERLESIGLVPYDIGGNGDCFSGLEITAGQRTMSGLIGELTSQLFVLPVMLTGHNLSYWKWNQLFQLL